VRRAKASTTSISKIIRQMLAGALDLGDTTLCRAISSRIFS
jgi:hypothetical protein